MGMFDTLLEIGADPPILSVSRNEIEARAVGRMDTLMRELSEPRLARFFRQRLWISVDGYDDDDRELLEVPEVRDWFQLFDACWPYCFFFMDPSQRSNLILLAGACCGVEYIFPKSAATRFWTRAFPRRSAHFRWANSVALAEYIRVHFWAMKRICRQLGDSDEVIAQMSHRILAAFERPNEA